MKKSLKEEKMFAVMRLSFAEIVVPKLSSKIIRDSRITWNVKLSASFWDQVVDCMSVNSNYRLIYYDRIKVFFF